MNDEEITRILKCSHAIYSNFLGFFARDQLRDIPLLPYHFAICNTGNNLSRIAIGLRTSQFYFFTNIFD